MTEEQYMTVTEVAAYLRVSRWTVRRMVDAGELGEVIKGDGPNGLLRIPVEGLHAYIQRHIRHAVTATEETR